ncbi:hypothetical protein SAMN04488029_0379 [Reichenbachiella faecimaris]|uniref:Lipocalin-like domain-containing protein n=1 Tax=Reichenbachiella faecimaris TaxID=692418 RepID=A0A1W2G620_REIFA|nr:hypothetical protein [Reichenbachiella faecimaris]SMD32041.1 hypothetical protein SAMN04488029_0379 [Reichenbachiella faecimaris]
MKKLLQTTLLACSLLFIASCSSDDEEPPHIVGNWTLEEFGLINLGPGYTESGEPTIPLNALSFGGVVIKSYELDISKNGTYVRTIGIEGSLEESVDEGTWELKDDEFTLTTTDGDDQGWEVQLNENSNLWLSFESQSPLLLISDEVRDEIRSVYTTQEEIDDFFEIYDLEGEDGDTIYSQPTVDFIYSFSKP